MLLDLNSTSWCQLKEKQCFSFSSFDYWKEPLYINSLPPSKYVRFTEVEKPEHGGVNNR